MKKTGIKKNILNSVSKMTLLFLASFFSLSIFATSDTVDLNTHSNLFSNSSQYKPYLEVGGVKYFNQESKAAGVYDLFLPLFSPNQNQLVFADLRIFDRTGSSFEGNMHLGYRFMSPEKNRLYGVYASFDRRKSMNKNYFNQITLGGEYWQDKWFFGGNFYLPFGKKSHITESVLTQQETITGKAEGKSIGYVREYNETVTTTSNIRVAEKAMYGFDAEVGHAFTDKITGYVGGYFFQDHLFKSKSERETASKYGPKLRLTYDHKPVHAKRLFGVLDGVSFEVGVQHDRPRGTTAYVGLRLKAGLVNSNTTKSNLSGFARHMTELVRRDPDIVLDKKNTAQTTKNIAREYAEGDRKKDKGELLEDFGLPPTVTFEDVKEKNSTDTKKYRKESKEGHPDKATSEEEKERFAEWQVKRNLKHEKNKELYGLLEDEFEVTDDIEEKSSKSQHAQDDDCAKGQCAIKTFQNVFQDVCDASDVYCASTEAGTLSVLAYEAEGSSKPQYVQDEQDDDCAKGQCAVKTFPNVFQDVCNASDVCCASTEAGVSDYDAKESDNKPEESLKEKFLTAKKRYQPYINLTNKIYSLASLLDTTVFEEYKELDLKSIYIRTSNIVLDSGFAKEIKELVKTGLKELLIFFHQEESGINTELFNRFIEENKIAINFKMVPVTDSDIENIRSDSIGRKDILGFVDLLDYKIIYKDGYTLSLLNNNESDEIILHNYADGRRIRDVKEFVLEEPEYIASSDPEAEKRSKDTTSGKRKNVQLEVSKIVDLDKAAEKSSEEEEELDLDLEQADNKFSHYDAVIRANKVSQRYFYERSQKTMDFTYASIYEVVKHIFESIKGMEFITSKALDLVLKEYLLFQDGIDVDNLPIGFAYKNKILFASDQRRASMSINEFTINPNPIIPSISNPLEYTWLRSATKASISLNDMYGSDIVPKVYGYDEHPAIERMLLEDIMLDIPSNIDFLRSDFGVDGARTRSTVTYDPLAKNTQEDRKIYFLWGYIYNLLGSEIEDLKSIHAELEKRGLQEIVRKIILSGSKSGSSDLSYDMGFLLDEKSHLFFKKIFQEILPISDVAKIGFFREVLQDHGFERYSFLEDIFEGLDGFYKNLGEFIAQNKISDNFREKIFQQSISVIKKQMEQGSSFRVLLGRFINILRMVLLNGGSLLEQLEYLDKDGAILRDPKQYWKAKELGLGIVHPTLALNANIINDKQDLSRSELTKQLFDWDYINSDWRLSGVDTPLISAIRYLATFPSHQRSSIETYSNYFLVESMQRSIDKKCFFAPNQVSSVDFKNHIELVDRESVLKVMDYYTFDDVNHRYQVKKFRTSEVMGVIRNPAPSFNLEKEDGKKYFIFIVDHGLNLEFGSIDGSKKINLLGEGQRFEELKEHISQYVKNDSEFFEIPDDQRSEFLQGFPDIQVAVKQSPELLEFIIDNDREEQTVSTSLRIQTDAGGYDLYFDRRDSEKLNKDSLVLPPAFDERVQECVSGDDPCLSVDILPSEREGTVFEYFSEPFVKERYFSNKPAEEKMRLLDSAPKEEVVHNCYAGVGVVSEGSNLVTNFTAVQAAENIKLLALNIMSSVGEHYDKLYPDQEFASYVSLFDMLLSDFKVSEYFQAGKGRYLLEEDYNHKTSYIIEKYGDVKKPIEVKKKEEGHKKVVDYFVRIYKENPVFNFPQVVALGLIDMLDHDLTDSMVAKSKELVSYNGYFTQMLRVILATPIDLNNFVVDELYARAKSVVRVFNHLFTEVNYQGDDVLVHQLVTNYERNPENLAIFASCFGQTEVIDIDKVNLFISKLENLPVDFKKQLFEGFATTKLPFAHGKIISNNFPIVSLDDLDNEGVLRDKIKSAKVDQIFYEEQTRFNDANVFSMEHSKVDFAALAGKYEILIPGAIESKRFSDIRKGILENKDFIKKNFIKDIEDQELIRKINFDVATAIFSVFGGHNIGWRLELQKIMTLLFDPKKGLEEQFLGIEAKHRDVSEILNSIYDAEERGVFLDSLLADPKIPYHLQDKVLSYFRSLDIDALKSKDYTLPKLVKDAGNRVISEYLDQFILVTDSFLKDDIGTSLESLYRFIENLGDVKYSKLNIEKIVNYCLENLNYSVIPVLAKLDGEADHIDEIVDWITGVSPGDIERIRSILGDVFEFVLTTKEIKKIKIMMEIVQKLNHDVVKDQYRLLADKIMRNDLNYASLVGSYLLMDNVKGLSQADIIKTVFEYIDSPESVQVIFNKYNLERFNYDSSRVIGKIRDIVGRNTADGKGVSLIESDQARLYELFTTVMGKIKSYSDLNINEIRELAIDLKHRRMLLKENKTEDNQEIDSEFLALSFEALYRSVGKFPRDTQILSVLLTTINPNHVIEEIATGQGKSIIAALQASYLCFTGQTVDVITSSPELAKKDRKEFAWFYQNLGLNTARSIITASSEANEYAKGGINYAVASDLALFRANRDFYSNTVDLELNNDVSLIGDEVDFVLTSGINFKLAAALVKMSQAEGRVLFDYIINFSNGPIFQNDDISREADVRNLKLYLDHQFQLYDASYHRPLTLVQTDALKKSQDPQARRLYVLNQALSKMNKHIDSVFDQLLSAVVVAKQLEEGVDYVILKESIENIEELMQATPIIKDQPSRGTVFGEGVQAFLHLMIEDRHSELKERFDVSIPSYTIFNVSPKNFFDYYRLAGGKIIGMTGTAGNNDEVEEFRERNKMLTFNIPRFEVDKKLVTHQEVESKEEQYQKLNYLIENTLGDRPAIIFAESTKEAEQVYQRLLDDSYALDRMHLYAISQHDTESLGEILCSAGKNNQITVTTPMLGRGTDFYTAHPEGFFGINLCTDITYSALMQIYGRVARNGHPGSMMSLFNKGRFEGAVELHMDKISEQEKSDRMKSQPLTDILRYFNYMNQDQAVNAIKCNGFITKTWNDLLKKYDEMLSNAEKSYIELRDELVELLRKEYPEFSKYIGGYLSRIDGGIPEKIDEQYLSGSSEMVCGSGGYCESFNLDLKHPTGYVVQKYNDRTVELKCFFKYQHCLDNYQSSVGMATIDIPESTEFGLFYSMIYKMQLARMATHAFEITNGNFKFNYEYDYKLSTTVPYKHSIQYYEFVLFLDDDKLYGQIEGKNPLEIKPAYLFEDGVPQNIYDGLLAKLQSFGEEKNVESAKMNHEEENAIYNHINAVVNDPEYMDGQGAFSEWTVYELKKSFSAYHSLVESVEVDQIANIIDNFANIRDKDLDLTKIESGKYQAVAITTKVTSSAYHAESLLTDGKFLFWINRGSMDPGIKVFKIIRDIEEVRDALNWMRADIYSQTDTRAKIYSLLREEDDNDIPEHIHIPMKGQIIGNCAWAQIEGMVKAAGIVNRLNEFDISLDELFDDSKVYDIKNRIKMLVESQGWQKILKDSEDVYIDFVTYDKLKRLEAMLFSMDKSFGPVFLDSKEQEEIDQMRDVGGNPVTHELIKKTRAVMKRDHRQFDNTIYEERFYGLLDIFDIEFALGEEYGLALQRVVGKQGAQELFEAYQKNRQNRFDDLKKIYKEIKDRRIVDKRDEDEALKEKLLSLR